MEIEPILVDRQNAKRILGGIGDTKFYELINSGEVERVYLGSKALFTMTSIKSLAMRLATTAPAPLARRNGNLKHVEA